MALFKDLQQTWSHRYGRYALIALMAAAVIAALLGGFRRAGAGPTTVANAKAGTTIASEAFAVTPLCAWSANVRPGQPDAMAGGERYLMLRAKVVSKARDWVAMRAYLDKDVVWLPAGKGEPVWPERSQRADDATLGYSLGPGLPVLVDFVWELPADMDVPGSTTWGMFRRRHVERTYASGEAMWVQDGAGWKFQLPVRQSCEAVTP